jgi:hypothetical protein
MRSSDRSVIQILWLLVTIAPTAALSSEPVGKLAMVRGDVFVDDKPVQSGAPVFATSKVRTGNGKAALLLIGESVIQLGYDSEIEVKSAIKKKGEPIQADMELSYGKVRALVKNSPAPKKFLIRSRSYTMGVRGTEVYLDNPKDPGQPPTFATIEGRAELASSPSAGALGAGTPTELPANQASSGGGQVRTLASSEAREMASTVTPPRAESFTVSEVQNSAAQRGTAGTSAATTQQTAPKLDPIADSSVLHPSAVIEPKSTKL